MNIYDGYVKTIKDAISADPVNGGLYQNFINESRSFSKGLSFETFNRRIPEKMLQPGLASLAEYLGVKPDFEQKLGAHMDFAHLKGTSHTENHYIISMFVDIKRSTNLFRRYTPQTVLIITNTIQRAAIHTCLLFGGYIHRLQGDGLFVYFGGKNVKPTDAVEKALQFASTFTYFVKEDLKNMFNEKGIETIFTRMGIDLGYEDDVVWACAGLGEISEITTCSLHTSLAPKMQGNAQSNGTVVGDNIVQAIPQNARFFKPVCKRTGDESDRYIYQIPERNFNYTQHDFDWLSYLKIQNFIATDLNGNLQLKTTSSPQRNAANLAPIAIASKPYFR